MAYSITLTNGTVLTSVANNTVDTTTSLTLIGRNFAGYGGYIAENFVHMLENFADTTAPSAPLTGQIWYNTTAAALQMYTGSAWVGVGFPADGVLKNTDITIQDGHLILSNTSAPSNQQKWRISVSNSSPYIGMLIFEALNDDNSVRNTVMALDGVNDLIIGKPNRLAHGQCRLGYVSTTSIKLNEFDGANLLIAGVQQQIPTGGISISNSGLAANTLYYVYASMSGSSMILSLSTTGHTPDTTATNLGVEIKSGDNTFTLVGMAWANGSSQFSALNVASWFNRHNISWGSATFTPSSTAGSLTQLTGTVVDFVTWTDEGVRIAIVGSMFNGTAGTIPTATSAGVDGAAGGAQTTPATTAANTTVVVAAEWNLGPRSVTLADGHHTASAFGAVGGGTGTWAIGVELSLRL